MNGPARWKEDRIRQEIYLRHLKHTNTAPNGAGHTGVNLRGWNGTSVPFLEKTPGTRSEKRIPNRGEKNRLPWIILRVALLAAGVATCLWVYLVLLVKYPLLMQFSVDCDLRGLEAREEISNLQSRSGDIRGNSNGLAQTRDPQVLSDLKLGAVVKVTSPP
jgi:hypothetical protein